MKGSDGCKRFREVSEEIGVRSVTSNFSGVFVNSLDTILVLSFFSPCLLSKDRKARSEHG